MTTADNKTYSFSLSSQMILGLILTGLPVIGGAAYGGLKFYSKMEKTIEAVDASKPYDDSEVRQQLQVLQIESKATKERMLQSMEAAVRIQEKASDAIALARETHAIAKGSAAEAKAVTESQGREVNAKLAQLQQQIESTTAALRSEMNTLKRATTNPLSK